jgi:hypothetical protein
MYITPHLHAVKDSWMFLIMFNRFWIFKIFKFYSFQIVSVEHKEYLIKDKQSTNGFFQCKSNEK